MQLKAQIGVEHIALLAVVFTILITGFSYYANISVGYQGSAFKALTISQGNQLTDTINKAPSLGENSIQIIILDLPDNFLSARLSPPNTLVFNLETENGIEQMIFLSHYNIIDDNLLTTLTSGKRKIHIISVDEGVCLSTDDYCGEGCGDGIISGTEVCDLNNLNGETCSSINNSYTGGILVCNSDCLSYSTGYCR